MCLLQFAVIWGGGGGELFVREGSIYPSCSLFLILETGSRACVWQSEETVLFGPPPPAFLSGAPSPPLAPPLLASYCVTVLFKVRWDEAQGCTAMQQFSCQSSHY